MRDLVDHHAREMMLDLTGERRPVPEMGRAGPAEPAGAVFAGPASQVHAGAGTAAHGAATAHPAWTRETAAVATLERLGYAWRGGQLWAPPIRGRTSLTSTPRVSEESRP